MSKKLAVLVSGTGSLLEAMVKDNLPISLVLADRHCRGLDEIAANAGIESVLVERKTFGKSFDRHAYTVSVMEELKRHDIELVAMAGFMTFFSPVIFETYGGRILNTHPSLLPSFKGHSAIKDALEFGAKVTGCTIHVATEKMDEGEILAQSAVTVLPDDTEETLHERVKQIERVLYPETIRALL